MNKERLNILYRGSLDSCNYDCAYCPFAKKKNTRSELEYDRNYLEKFVLWIASQKRELGILFTPWGEALIRSYYQKAISELCSFEHITKVAIQTNLSSSLKWLEQTNTEKLALWTTFHPTELKIEKYLSKCFTLMQLGINFSVGIVGTKENFESARLLRANLPKQIYVWVNAYKREPHYYTNDDLDFLNKIDPLFNLNNTVYETYGEHCIAGEKSISIDELGNIRRCHFIKEIKGNIYEDNLKTILKPRVCSNQTCKCYIGYMNLNKLNLGDVYGERILERIPQQKIK